VGTVKNDGDSMGTRKNSRSLYRRTVAVILQLL